MKCKLNDICTYRRDKVKVSSLGYDNYISTENMLPDKGGIVRATGLPSSIMTQKFQKGDILVSNIRPYFKKIWMAEYDGGCSNDVLVFTANNNTDPTFLYYLLSDDAFFAYSTATSKGTKMPRGDRAAIMDYNIPAFDISSQKRISNILQPLDCKIRLNSKINNNLEYQTQTLYHNRFENIDKEDLPIGWHIVTLGELVTISKKAFNPEKEAEIELEHYSIPAFDETKFPVFESSKQIKSNKYIVDESCFMISKLNPNIKRVWRPYCLTKNAVCSTEFIVYKAKDLSMTDYLYSVVDSASFTDFMCSHVTGSTGSRQRTTPSDTLDFELVIPSEKELQDFQALVSPMYAQIKYNAIENEKLKKLRDILLPKLMAGEITKMEM